MGMHCHHGEHHFHHHHHSGLAEGMSPSYLKKLKQVMLLGLLYFIAQVLGSYFSGSLALLADAGHKLADIAVLGLALFAAWFGHKAVSAQKTFGFHRLEIVAALINGGALMLIAVFILLQAWQRFSHQEAIEVEGGIMMLVAVFGLIINLISVRLLYPAKALSLNVKGAIFHLMADILNSVGEMLTAGGILLFRLYWLDTLVSVLIAAVVLYNASRVFSEAFHILMESAPKHLDVSKVEAHILQTVGVTGVHDLHIWTIATGKDAILAHVQVTADAFIHETARHLETDLRTTFDFCHITLQLEPPGFEEAEILF